MVPPGASESGSRGGSNRDAWPLREPRRPCAHRASTLSGAPVPAVPGGGGWRASPCRACGNKGGPTPARGVRGGAYSALRAATGPRRGGSGKGRVPRVGPSFQVVLLGGPFLPGDPFRDNGRRSRRGQGMVHRAGAGGRDRAGRQRDRWLGRNRPPVRSGAGAVRVVRSVSVSPPQ